MTRSPLPPLSLLPSGVEENAPRNPPGCGLRLPGVSGPSRGLCPCPGTGPPAQHPGLRARRQAPLPKRLPDAAAPSQASRPPLHFKEHPQSLTPVPDSSGAPCAPQNEVQYLQPSSRARPGPGLLRGPSARLFVPVPPLARTRGSWKAPLPLGFAHALPSALSPVPCPLSPPIRLHLPGSFPTPTGWVSCRRRR